MIFNTMDITIVKRKLNYESRLFGVNNYYY
jgi:hypothetical protein